MKHFSFLISLLCLVLHTSAQIITTVAGTGTYGFSGDGGPATAAMLAHPEGVAIDQLGNLYICDNKCVRKVSPAVGGTITTFAGVGTSTGYSGDGGPAHFARVSGVHDVAVDKYGNVYLADAGNNRVRKVTLDGIINTIAGTGIAGYNGDGIAATTAELNSPFGVAVDDTGNVYIADLHNMRIRKVSTAGIISTVAGTGVKGFSGDGGMADTAMLHHPIAVEVAKNGELYIADSTRIRKINTMGVISTVAGVATFGFSGDGGPATAAEVTPYSIALDTFGNLLIADADRIRKVNTVGVINTVAGTGLPIYNGDNIHPMFANIRPYGITVDKYANIYIGDLINNRARLITDSQLAVSNLDNVALGVRIFPAPSSSYCKVIVTNANGKLAHLKVTNIAGVEVYQQSIPANKEVTMPTPWPAGVYVVTVDIDGQHITKRLVVK
ncbi:MAG: T9SS type A sorting domain-containing protein [Flavipsychrobacter sp.]|nr:T9SS type A sorting domain-containing protein [Flavipsychrobacter sp.]